MTATPKPYPPMVGYANAVRAEAPTMALPADHPYWEIPDELRRGIHYDRDLERFTVRGDIARRLRHDHGWTAHMLLSGSAVIPSHGNGHYEVRPPQRPKVTQVPAREVAKRLIDGERVVVESFGGRSLDVAEWAMVDEGRDELRMWLSGDQEIDCYAYSWDSTVPVIEDTP